MPHNSAQWVSHRIDGGWATDYGNTYYASPQDGTLTIPWCRTCENIKFYPDGGFGKYPGMDRATGYPLLAPPSSSGLGESSYVHQVYDYVRMGASLTGTRKSLALAGSWLYEIQSASPNVLIGDVLATNLTYHHLTTFNDLLIISGPTPKSWDQTTFQSLAGTPPAFSFSTAHAGRHWAAGVAALPSRLYYSAVGNPEDWVGAGSGSIDIDPGDGDAIVALLSWKRELWVFKGPNRLSIHRITGTSSSDFARLPFVYGISAAGPQSIFPVGDDFGFWSPRGSCHSLTATSNYGDYTHAYLNYPILSWCRNPDNLIGGTSGYHWQTVTDTSQNITYCVLNNLRSSVITGTMTPFVLLMDWKFRTETNPYPRFIQLKPRQTITSVGLQVSQLESAQLVAGFGTKDGLVLQEYTPASAFFQIDDAAFPYRLETPALTYGPSVYTKTITAVSVDISENSKPYGDTYGDLDFTYGGRGAPAQTLTFSNRDGAVLGAFTLGTSQLGGATDIDNSTEAVTGESRAFSYAMVEDGALQQSVGTDVRVKQFSVLITPSGESLEDS